MASLKKNFLYKATLTFSNYIIGFITFPYITRVLGPANFGTVNFALNTVDYFLLFASMGIVTIGTREVAAYKSDQVALSREYSNILGLNIVFTLLSLIIYLLAIWYIPKFATYKSLFLIGSAKILFTAFTVEWLFTGLENFRYITFRNLSVRIIYVVCVFIFIKEPSDYVLYFILTIAVVVVNALINFIYSTKFVRIIYSSLISLKYIKQNLRLGVYTIMTSMYVTFNVMYLGLVSTDLEVGYYSTAVRIYFVAVNLFSAFTAVMLPRISTLLAQNDFVKINAYFNMSLHLVALTAVPIIIVCGLFTPQIINLIAGDGYQYAILPMRILMPALLLVWISQVVVFQLLIPRHQDNLLLVASIIGGVVAIGLNILITPKFKAIGSAITMVTCETIVTFFYILICKKKHFFPKINYGKFLIDGLWLLPYIGSCVLLYELHIGVWNLPIVFVLSAFYYWYLQPMKRIRN